mmetsp:Transcript_17488/g.15417  ORF Transcript_17488/g.15417 Transcript_17488/m.15417 type:complete len:106 (-) Transcript_17488:290-607(-)
MSQQRKLEYYFSNSTSKDLPKSKGNEGSESSMNKTGLSSRKNSFFLPSNQEEEYKVRKGKTNFVGLNTFGFKKLMRNPAKERLLNNNQGLVFLPTPRFKPEGRRG